METGAVDVDVTETGAVDVVLKIADPVRVRYDAVNAVDEAKETDTAFLD